MKLSDLLSIIEHTAKRNKISKPYIVGGFVRDILLKRVDEIKDVDITCGDKSSLLLGPAVVKNIKGATLMSFNDGHSRLSYGSIYVDFSNNFIVPNIKKLLHEKNIKYTKIMYEELYSRDFTMNSLLMPLDMSSISDLTNEGIADINKKIIKTCLNPEITFTSDPKRIIRLIYLCSKLNFNPDHTAINWVKKNGNLLSKVNNIYIRNKIIKAMKYDKEKTISLLNTLNLIKYIPNVDTIAYKIEA
ncbi:MAG: hypothetical protein ACOYMA_00285 [Bacteroidia bacterium]